MNSDGNYVLPNSLGICIYNTINQDQYGVNIYSINSTITIPNTNVSININCTNRVYIESNDSGLYTCYVTLNDDRLPPDIPLNYLYGNYFYGYKYLVISFIINNDYFTSFCYPFGYQYLLNNVNTLFFSNKLDYSNPLWDVEKNNLNKNVANEINEVFGSLLVNGLHLSTINFKLVRNYSEDYSKFFKVN